MKIPEVWTAEDVIKLQKLIAMINVDSLDKVIVSEGEEVGELGNLVQDPSPGPDELLERKDALRILNIYVEKLKPRECMVIKMRYGLEDGKFKTLDEVGKQFGVSRERVRQIEAKGLKKLKWLLTAQGKYRSINDF